jgi:hypothetical protein
MDRQTLAQAVAMLVVLGMLVRWLPPPSAREAREDWFGRGAPLYTLRIDRQMSRQDPHDPRVLALMMGSTRRPVYTKRFYEMLTILDRLREELRPEDVVQLRNFSRNEIWMITYFLFPQRLVGRPLRDGDDASAPVHPEADWVFTAGDLFQEDGVEKSGPASLERARR